MALHRLEKKPKRRKPKLLRAAAAAAAVAMAERRVGEDKAGAKERARIKPQEEAVRIRISALRVNHLPSAGRARTRRKIRIIKNLEKEEVQGKREEVVEVEVLVEDGAGEGAEEAEGRANVRVRRGSVIKTNKISRSSSRSSSNNKNEAVAKDVADVVAAEEDGVETTRERGDVDKEIETSKMKCALHHFRN
mmetsp:Transcript_28142/g.39298  ORF Transcript_28142/g.39298 Transcript_28142/m.39298 type:complete len:192 (+) Transcript_28142:321-896(+)